MPDEPTATQTQTVPTGGQPAAQPVPPVVPVVQPTPTEPAPGGAGKTVEQLETELQEKQRLVDEALERAARAEHEATYSRNLYEQSGRQKPTEEPEKPIFTDEEFITSPATALNKVARQIEGRLTAELDRRDNLQKAERAKENFIAGRKVAVEKFPKLMAGIENRVANEVAKGLIDGVISYESTLDPKLWATTAMTIRFAESGETDLNKYFGGESRVVPVKAGYTETPTASAPSKNEVVLSDDDRATARSWKITDEQMLAEKKRSIEEKTRLAR